MNLSHIDIVKKALHLLHHKCNAYLRETTDATVATSITGQKMTTLKLINEIREIGCLHDLQFCEKRIVLIALNELANEDERYTVAVQDSKDLILEAINQNSPVTERLPFPGVVINKWKQQRISINNSRRNQGRLAKEVR